MRRKYKKLVKGYMDLGYPRRKAQKFAREIMRRKRALSSGKIKKIF